jgi:hypothetical protein
MSVTLPVSQVRRELYWAAGGRAAGGGGAHSTALLGQLFHEVFAALVRPDDDRNIAAALGDSEPDLQSWRSDLLHHAYRRLVGPRLREHQAVLSASAREVLALWQAVREVCDWLADVLWNVCEQHRSKHGHAPGLDELLRKCVRPEQPLEWELHDPQWSDSVRLVGIADAVLRAREQWCVVELKLGQTAPEADLAQACLYHRILQEGDAASADGALAVIGFLPERQERLFESAELADAGERLKALIGRLAGVVRDVAPEPEPPAQVELVAPANDRQFEQGRRLVETFREYGAPIELDGEPIVGPTFLRFPISLGRGVKLAAVRSRVHEVQIRLELAEPPIIDVAQGRVVIDLQRPDRQYVEFAQVRRQFPAGDSLIGCSQVPIGIDLDGRLEFADLAETEHAHLLVAGTTGSGKSEWLRAAVAGLLVANTPDTLRLLIIDPKRNAFHDLRNSPFLLRPIVFPDEQPIAGVLSELADEMDARYATFNGADSLTQYVERTGGRPVPRIVCVCDEYFDLISQGRSERQALEAQIFRLGAKARAAGIHLILATQQPSRQVIKGALDANIPARVGLKMNSAIESRMLLGAAGAESLLGNGDLLFKDVGPPRRLQSIYVPAAQRAEIFSTQLAAVGN